MKDNIDFNSLFKTYEPPEGGIQGLREKLDRPLKKVRVYSIPKLTVMVTLAVVALVTVVFTPYLNKSKSNSFVELIKKSENPSFIKYGYIKRSSEEISFPVNARSQFASMRIETSNKKVKFYLIDSIN